MKRETLAECSVFLSARHLAHAVLFFRGQNMAAVHSVHQALTNCTSQQCCQVAEFAALFHECEGTENLLAVNRKWPTVVLRNYQNTFYFNKNLKNETQSLNGHFDNLA